jgi:hypothetical protein
VKTENFAAIAGEKDPLDHCKTLFRTTAVRVPAAENSQSNAEERAEKEVFRKSFLQLRKSCDRLCRKNHSCHGGRLNQYCRHDQNRSKRPIYISAFLTSSAVWPGFCIPAVRLRLK